MPCDVVRDHLAAAGAEHRMPCGQQASARWRRLCESEGETTDGAFLGARHLLNRRRGKFATVAKFATVQIHIEIVAPPPNSSIHRRDNVSQAKSPSGDSVAHAPAAPRPAGSCGGSSGRSARALRFDGPMRRILLTLHSVKMCLFDAI